jgi:hypothetical protein
MMVTAREMATGFTFTFEVKTRRLLRTLRVGRPVWADFVGRAVSLGSDERPCCSIVPTAAPPDPR